MDRNAIIGNWTVGSFVSTAHPPRHGLRSPRRPAGSRTRSSGATRYPASPPHAVPAWTNSAASTASPTDRIQADTRINVPPLRNGGSPTGGGSGEHYQINAVHPCGPAASSIADLAFPAASCRYVVAGGGWFADFSLTVDIRSGRYPFENRFFDPEAGHIANSPPVAAVSVVDASQARCQTVMVALIPARTCEAPAAPMIAA
ncbi:hypothetical protein [Saccharothrix deserti]|uniref:hypothetical protein n=1 Tax=Saccharothrix deserti TaxID=2593674 RepID=UPI001EE3CE1C|nr:hypothetical protein [Saccharothrix deserti]